MRIEDRDEMFRCEHTMCKNFASKEIMIGGYKKGISLCLDHYLELVGLIKNDVKNSRLNYIKSAKEKIID